MPSRPSLFLDWTDGNVSKVLKPPSAQQLSGWTLSERPPFRYVNWLFWLTDQWIQWLDFISGALPVSQTVTTTTTIAAPTSVYFANVTGGGFVLTLPTNSLNLDYEVTIKNVAIGSSNLATVTASGTDKIENGSAGGSITLAQGDVAKLKSNGAGQWWLINS